MKDAPTFEALRAGRPYSKHLATAFKRRMESLEPGSPESEIVCLFFREYRPSGGNVYKTRTLPQGAITHFIWNRELADVQKYMLAWARLQMDHTVLPAEESHDITEGSSWPSEYEVQIPTGLNWKIAL